MSFYSCDTDPGTYTQNQCPIILGRVRNMALITETGYNAITDWTVKAQWDTQELNGELIRIRNTRGNKPVGSPVQVDGFGNQVFRLAGRDQTAQVFVPGTPQNRNFWNQVSQNDGYHVALQIGEGSDEYNLITTVPCSVIADVDAPLELNSETVYQVDIAWSAIDIVLYEANPANNYM